MSLLKPYLYLLATLVFSTLLYPAETMAGESEYVDPQTRIVKNYTSYYLNDDFTVNTTLEYQLQILDRKSVANGKEMRFSYSTSIEKLQILEAYTLKQDGTKVNVPENNYQVNINKGYQGKGPVFSDRTKITVVFPDLEVNDSIYIKTLRTESEPMFPGNFGVSGFFWSQTAFDDVKITLNIPENLMYNYKSRGMEEKKSKVKNREIIELTYANPKPKKLKRHDYSAWDEENEVGYAISSFNDYSSIAQAYASRAEPKAVPTKRVKQLAKEIVGTETDKLAQARLLYDWVATEITYAGNCIGIGAVVPHDTDFILDNLMGDCKDHATLLEALLTSQGISSVQALVNSGSRYTLPEIPLVSSVNHVINYLPAWDKYVDSTSATTPFDLIPFSIADKPVILVKTHKPGLRTPKTSAEQNYQLVEADMNISEDGTLTGNVKLELKGYSAAETRSSWRNATPAQEQDWIESTFSSKSSLGKGSIEKDDPKPLKSSFNYTVMFEHPEFIFSKGAGGFYISPPLQTAAPISAFTDYTSEPIHGYDISCGNGISEEKMTYHFPDGMRILAKPEDFVINENYLLFEATYTLHANTLDVYRKIEDRTPGNICSADLMNKQRLTLIKINENLSSQLIYQQ